jgi:hypothetical protein
MANTYKQILAKAELGTLRRSTWEKHFKPAMDEDGQILQFETYEWDKMLSEASKYAEEQDKLYRNFWAVVDGDGNKLIALNGRHACNVMFYVVCEEPWGDGSAADADVYIEARY